MDRDLLLLGEFTELNDLNNGFSFSACDVDRVCFFVLQDGFITCQHVSGVLSVCR